MPRIHHSFAELLKEAKRHGKLTNASLAKTLSISVKTIEQWLAGERSPLAITQEGALARLSGRRLEGTTEEMLRQVYEKTFQGLGLSQEQFAKSMGVTAETIYMRMGGALPITLEAMMAAHGLAAIMCESIKEDEITGTA